MLRATALLGLLGLFSFAPAVAQQWFEPTERVTLAVDNRTGREVCITFNSIGGTCNVPPGRSEYKLPQCGLDMRGSPYCVYTATIHAGETQIGQIVTNSGIVTNQYDLSTMWVCATAHIPADVISRYWQQSGGKEVVADWYIEAEVEQGCQPPSVIRR